VAVPYPAGWLCGRVDPASAGPRVVQSWGPREAHCSFLCGPMPTFPSTGKERPHLKGKANLRNISLYTNIWAPSFFCKE